MLGDSLSAGYGVPLEQGWVALLQNRLDAEGYEYRVVNASITGDTTSGGLRRLPRALDIHQPDIVIIELGGNDGLRGTPPELTREHLRRMIELCRERGARVLLAGIRLPPNYGARYTEAFARIYQELAEEYRLALIPFFMEGVALNPQLMQADRIHPNAAAQRRLLDNAWAALAPLLESARSG